MRRVIFGMTENQRCERINNLPSERVSDLAEISDWILTFNISGHLGAANNAFEGDRAC